jgi:hypothetical protein
LAFLKYILNNYLAIIVLILLGQIYLVLVWYLLLENYRTIMERFAGPSDPESHAGGGA